MYNTYIAYIFLLCNFNVCSVLLRLHQLWWFVIKNDQGHSCIVLVDFIYDCMDGANFNPWYLALRRVELTTPPKTPPIYTDMSMSTLPFIATTTAVIFKSLNWRLWIRDDLTLLTLRIKPGGFWSNRFFSPSPLFRYGSQVEVMGPLQWRARIRLQVRWCIKTALD